MFEQPPCPDGHGGECPERACVECGTAVLVGLLPAAPGPAPAEGHDTSPSRTGSVRAVA
ncbi:hypothetical protein AGRA3207_001287 [Actinomadura graeca]|uniref:Uncharacterized protein n=1 Tax=Actinomadura graeca TaxID=2750812 RepID=A0ABX8QP33_9ACTN|nr:hypothetical protein [Actinomadura graeca]QXJ20556.1 hypothetical protein AGRA3207_001287 [Actinomadura graeca]